MKKLMLAMMWMVLSSCEERVHDHAKTDEKVLRTYEVPPGTARELVLVLRQLGNGGKDAAPEVKAEELPDGKLAVFASEHVQSGIAPLLKSASGKSALVTVDYRVWQVIGKPATKTSFGPGLGAIQTQLEAAANVYGPMDFTLFYPTQIRLVAGERGEVRNTLGNVQFAGSVAADHIFAKITIQSNFEDSSIHFETLVQLAPGQSTVLGQNVTTSKKDPQPQTIFYVVNADLVR